MDFFHLYHVDLNFGLTAQSVLLVIYYVYKNKLRMFQENTGTNAKCVGLCSENITMFKKKRFRKNRKHVLNIASM